MELHPFMAMAITARLLTLTLATAILFVILIQLRRDSTSRALAGLIGIFALNTLVAVIVRFMSLSDLDVSFPFKFIVVAAASIPAMVFIFVVNYLSHWTPWRRRAALLMMIYIPTVGFCAGMDWLNYDVHIALPEGTLEFGRTPLAHGFVFLGQVWLCISLAVIWRDHHRRVGENDAHSGQILAGVFVLVLAGATIAVPALTRFTIEQFLYAAAIVILSIPILRNRLFDPLAQLNARLHQRANQFAAITRVSQQALAHLRLDDLLNAVAQEIWSAFGCYAVVLYLPHEDTLVVHAAAGEAAKAFVDSGDRRQISYLERTAQITNEAHLYSQWQHPLHPEAVSVARIPLLGPGKTNPLIGVLDIKRKGNQPLSTDDLEALKLLANQLGIAIHNTNLFERLQRSDTYKSHFIHTLSHELRTPIQTVMCHLAFAKSSTDYLMELDAAEHALDHLHSLLKGILDMGKIESGQMELVREAVDPVAVLRSVEATYTSSIREGVKLVRAYPETLPPIFADEIRLQQILGNLLSNACKFTETGSITLDAEVMPGFVRFSIEDTGPGIAENVRPKLFTSFGQGSRFISRAYGGSGLGLTICRELVKLHGGEVWFESAEGKGSTFYCTIPYVTDFAVEKPSESAGAITRFSTPDRVPVQVVVIGAAPGKPAYMDADFDPACDYRVVLIESFEDGLRVVNTMQPALVVCTGSASLSFLPLSQSLNQSFQEIVVCCDSDDWQSIVDRYFTTQKETVP